MEERWKSLLNNDFDEGVVLKIREEEEEEEEEEEKDRREETM